MKRKFNKYFKNEKRIYEKLHGNILKNISDVLKIITSYCKEIVYQILLLSNNFLVKKIKN